MKKYIITASCDPYHAKFHHNGERVLKHNGATPVEWVIDDNFGEGYASEEEAAKELYRLAKSGVFDGRHDGWREEDEESVAAFAKVFKEDTGEDYDASWYKGVGIYDSQADNEPVIIRGETSFRDDVMTYCLAMAAVE